MSDNAAPPCEASGATEKFEDSEEASEVQEAFIEDRADRDHFHAVFRTESSAIREALGVFVSSPEAGTVITVHKTLDDLLSRVQRLEVEYTRASELLKAYDQMACRKELRGLSDDIAGQRARLAPRKKFGFRRKASAATTGADPPSSADASTKSSPGTTLPATTAGAVETAGEVIKDLNGEVLVFRPGTLVGRDVTLRALQGCRIVLLDHIGALHCHDLRNCDIVACAIGSSALLYKCSECILTLAAKQLRLHDSQEISLHLHTKSNPVIEHCQRISVSPFDLLFPDLGNLWIAAGLGSADGGMPCVQSGPWMEVQDFNWHRRQSSPNWCLVPPSDHRHGLEFHDLEAVVAALGSSDAARATVAEDVVEQLGLCTKRWEAAEAETDGRLCTAPTATNESVPAG